jgi:hypothetical protein
MQSATIKYNWYQFCKKAELKRPTAKTCGLMSLIGAFEVFERGCEINCVNGHRIVKLFDMKGILWLTGHRNN